MTDLTKETYKFSENVIGLAADIVASYVSNNDLPRDQLPLLIRDVHFALAGLDNIIISSDYPRPAVPVAKSITDEYLICLEDGKKFKSLKRHLRSKYNMTPEDYRIKWGLPHDYPMVSPGYARKRSNLAKEIGLGRNKN